MEELEFSCESDVNSDSLIDILDVITLISIILI